MKILTLTNRVLQELWNLLLKSSCLSGFVVQMRG